jgi:hypothetical protein
MLENETMTRSLAKITISARHRTGKSMARHVLDGFADFVGGGIVTVRAPEAQWNDPWIEFAGDWLMLRRDMIAAMGAERDGRPESPSSKDQCSSGATRDRRAA